MEQILNYIFENWETGLGIAAILLEIGLRIIPTEKNRSIFDLVVKTIGFIIKNRRKPSPLDEIEGTKNKVWVDVKKHIIPIVFLFASIGCVGQVNSTFKSARSYNADSTTVRNEVNALQNFYGDIGALYYNEQSSKWRLFQDSVWYDLRSSGGGGGGTYTAGSGLTLTGTEFKLGGSLTEDMFLDGGNFLFALTNVNDIGLYSTTGSFSAQNALILESNNDEVTINTGTNLVTTSQGTFSFTGGNGETIFSDGGGLLHLNDVNGSTVLIGQDIDLNAAGNFISNSSGFFDIEDGASHIITSDNINGMRVGVVGQNYIDILDNGNVDITTGAQFNINGLSNAAASNVLFYDDATGTVTWDVAPSVSASNGLSVSGSDVVLGGSAITSNTLVDGNGTANLDFGTFVTSPINSFNVYTDAGYIFSNRATTGETNAINVFGNDIQINPDDRIIMETTGTSGSSISIPFLDITKKTDTNNDISEMLNYTLESPSTVGANGIGQSFLYFIENSAGATPLAFSKTIELSDVTSTLEDAAITEQIIINGSLTTLTSTTTSTTVGLSTTHSGVIVMPNLPTDCTGQVTGTLWSDSGTLKVCP